MNYLLTNYIKKCVRLLYMHIIINACTKTCVFKTDIVDSSFIYLVLLNGFVNQCCDPSNCCCTNHHCDSYDQNASYAYNITEK